MSKIVAWCHEVLTPNRDFFPVFPNVPPRIALYCRDFVRPCLLRRLVAERLAAASGHQDERVLALIIVNFPKFFDCSSPIFKELYILKNAWVKLALVRRQFMFEQ